jgi:hypothetical protein
MRTEGDSSGTRASALTVTDLVQHGSGRSSRFDLTVSYEGRTVRLKRIPVEEVLTYRRIRELAVGYGVLLPWYASGNREALSRAMESARFEMSLEGGNPAPSRQPHRPQSAEGR